MYCGYDASCFGNSCTFDKCMKMAKDIDAYAFAYRPAPSVNYVCRLCDKAAFDNRTIFTDNAIYNPWGIYRKNVPGKFVNRLHQCHKVS